MSSNFANQITQLGGCGLRAIYKKINFKQENTKKPKLCSGQSSSQAYIYTFTNFSRMLAYNDIHSCIKKKQVT